MDGVVRDRIRMALNGLVIVTVILDEQDELLGEAWIELLGLPEIGKGNRNLAETLESDVTQFLEGAGRKVLSNDDKLDEAIKRVVRQVAMEEIGKKPEVVVIASRLALD